MMWDFPAWWNARERHVCEVFNMLVEEGEHLDHFEAFVNNGLREWTQICFTPIAIFSIEETSAQTSGFKEEEGYYTFAVYAGHVHMTA